MSTEWGPLVGWFPVDEVTIEYLRDVRRRLKEQGTERFTKQDINLDCYRGAGPLDTIWANPLRI